MHRENINLVIGKLLEAQQSHTHSRHSPRSAPALAFYGLAPSLCTSRLAHTRAHGHDLQALLARGQKQSSLCSLLQPPSTPRKRRTPEHRACCAGRPSRCFVCGRDRTQINRGACVCANIKTNISNEVCVCLCAADKCIVCDLRECGSLLGKKLARDSRKRVCLCEMQAILLLG